MRSLVNRFKEFRRPKKPRSRPSVASTPAKCGNFPGKSPGIMNTIKSPAIPPGEDCISYGRHIKVLQVEFKKTNRNSHVLESLMERTFAMRREEIMEKGYEMNVLFDRFPFLQEVEQVYTVCILIGKVIYEFCLFYTAHG